MPQANLRLALFEQLGLLARQRYQAAERGFAPLGLGHTEARLLSLLQRAGGEAAQEELAGQLQLDRSNCGRALALLEQKGLLARQPSRTDGRAKRVALSPAGRERLGEIEALRRRMARQFFSRLNQAEVEQALALLSKVGPDA